MLVGRRELMTEKAQSRPHSVCWTKEGYKHRCQRPSGRRCIDCGEPAGTLWGPIWCPDCDVIRLGNVSAGFAAIEAAIPAEEQA